MDKALLVGVAGVFVTVLFAALSISRQLGRIEQKVDTMWQWWMTRGADVKIGGRRRTDIAADRSG